MQTEHTPSDAAIEGALTILPPASQELPGISPQGVAIQAMGAVFADDTPTETVEYVMARAAQLSRGTQFILADAMNHQAKHGREDFERWANLTGIHEKDLRNIARVGRKVRLEHRKDQFTFDFWRAIAAAPEEEQEHWAEATSGANLTKGQLRKSMIAGSVQKEAGPVDSGKDNVVPHVGKISALLDKMKDSGTLDKAAPEQLYALHRDLLPLLRTHATLIRRLSRTGDMDAMRKVKLDLAAIHRD